MRQRMMQFMVGRNGNDDLNRFLLVVDLVLLLLSTILRGTAGRILWPLALLLLVFLYFRMFSRDLLRRGDENTRYIRVRERFLSWLRVRKEKWVQRKEFKFFSCPACKATMRVPRGRGKIKIVCRKCGNSFMGKS